MSKTLLDLGAINKLSFAFFNFLEKIVYRSEKFTRSVKMGHAPGPTNALSLPITVRMHRIGQHIKMQTWFIIVYD